MIAALLACGSCYGLADGPMIDAAQMGIWFMLGTVMLVQGGFAAFFIYLRRQAARAAAPGGSASATAGTAVRGNQ